MIDFLDNNNEDCEQLAYQINDISKITDVYSFLKFTNDFNYNDTFFYKLRSSDDYTNIHFQIFDKLTNI